MDKKDLTPVNTNGLDKLEEKIARHIDSARKTIQRTVDSEMVKAYWLSGRDIVEEEQRGQARAQYGAFLIQWLSDRLTRLYGRGFSLSTLKDMRYFFLEYQGDIESAKGHALRGFSMPEFHPALGWIHYRALMRIKHSGARKFYEKEAIENCWSGRELERQIGSLLFERLAKSKDKEGIMKLCLQGQEITQPEDAIKDPLILEFLSLPESHQLVESKIEMALIDNLQKFLLELGKGFSFVARQKRLSLDGDHFYADLVFYHVILKCYVIIDIKTRPVSQCPSGKLVSAAI